MDSYDERIIEAVKKTEILRPPKQLLDTFGVTDIHYYLLTEPVYAGFTENDYETVIREGRVIAERPKVITPYYLNRLEGFSEEARKYFKFLRHSLGPNAPSILYSYKNQPTGLSIVPGRLPAVVERVNSSVNESGERLAVIIKGEDSLWDVSLLKFIYELTQNSLKNNIAQLNSKGLLGVDEEGIPLDVRRSIEEHFIKVVEGESDPRTLKEELERWQLFDEYQDRFFTLFKKR
jgi:hypothetical protein